MHELTKASHRFFIGQYPSLTQTYHVRPHAATDKTPRVPFSAIPGLTSTLKNFLFFSALYIQHTVWPAFSWGDTKALDKNHLRIWIISLHWVWAPITIEIRSLFLQSRFFKITSCPENLMINADQNKTQRQLVARKYFQRPVYPLFLWGGSRGSRPKIRNTSWFSAIW